METLGNISLLEWEKIGYFASGKIAPLSVLPTLDWATEMAQRDDIVVVSGFHSKTELEVLDFLLRGRCGIICVLARSIYKNIPLKFRKAHEEDRILFISNISEGTPRDSRYRCMASNQFIASVADSLVFSSLTPESSLYPLSQTSKPIKTL